MYVPLTHSVYCVKWSLLTRFRLSPQCFCKCKCSNAECWHNFYIWTLSWHRKRRPRTESLGVTLPNIYYILLNNTTYWVLKAGLYLSPIAICTISAYFLEMSWNENMKIPSRSNQDQQSGSRCTKLTFVIPPSHWWRDNQPPSAGGGGVNDNWISQPAEGVWETTRLILLELTANR